MKRMILGTALAMGWIVFAGRPALAQRQEGWPMEGELGWTTSQQVVPAVRSEVVVTDWRYNNHNNRWWYWTPENKLLYWNDGRWQEYAVDAGPVPYTSNYRGPTNSNDLSGWYWRDSDRRLVLVRRGKC